MCVTFLFQENVQKAHLAELRRSLATHQVSKENSQVTSHKDDDIHYTGGGCEVQGIGEPAPEGEERAFNHIHISSCNQKTKLCLILEIYTYNSYAG